VAAQGLLHPLLEGGVGFQAQAQLGGRPGAFQLGNQVALNAAVEEIQQPLAVALRQRAQGRLAGDLVGQGGGQGEHEVGHLQGLGKEDEALHIHQQCPAALGSKQALQAPELGALAVAPKPGQQIDALRIRQVDALGQVQDGVAPGVVGEHVDIEGIAVFQRHRPLAAETAVEGLEGEGGVGHEESGLQIRGGKDPPASVGEGVGRCKASPGAEALRPCRNSKNLARSGELVGWACCAQPNLSLHRCLRFSPRREHRVSGPARSARSCSRPGRR
jgi:hypothetical protein